MKWNLKWTAGVEFMRYECQGAMYGMAWRSKLHCRRSGVGSMRSTGYRRYSGMAAVNFIEVIRYGSGWVKPNVPYAAQ